MKLYRLCCENLKSRVEVQFIYQIKRFYFERLPVTILIFTNKTAVADPSSHVV